MSAEGSRKSKASVLDEEEEGEIKTGALSGFDLAAVISDDFGNELLVWPEGYYADFDTEPSQSGKSSSKKSEKMSSTPSRESYYYGEDNEAFDFFYYAGEQEEVEPEKAPTKRGETSEPSVTAKTLKSQDSRRRSIFVHSSPTNFSDINKARKSVFGSIFIRTTGHAEEIALLRNVAESNYSMLRSLFSSFDKIIADNTSEMDRKHMALAYKDSILKLLEGHGITRTYSDGSVHWDIYPIAQSYLFTVQLEDHIHQTRHLSRIEDRIVTGPVQTLRFPYGWPTESLWTGHWDMLGMAGLGSYVMPHDVSYNGKMKDGVFQDDNGTLTYPNRFKALHCVYDQGILLNCQFQFPDLLLHEKENWGYCKFPDRRFWSEVRNGLKPAKIAQKTELDPPRRIPQDCYDTNDGFYDPVTLILSSPTGEMIRVPNCEEDMWIKKYCRKGFFQNADFRPDLYENWFNYDQELIQTILKAQEDFTFRRITYNELQQRYANLGLLGSLSAFQKYKTPKEIAEEEFWKSIPDPIPLKKRKEVRNYKGHKIETGDLGIPSQTEHKKHGSVTMTKSFIRFTDETKLKATGSQFTMNSRPSRIYFRDSAEGFREEVDTTKREIPERFLKHQPILRPPFESFVRSAPVSNEKLKKCPTKKSFYSESTSWGAMAEDQDGLEDTINALEMFMKKIIMEIVNEILILERENHRQRLKWAKKVHQKPSRRLAGPHDTCMKILDKLLETVLEKEEYCDSDMSKTCHFKGLSKDKYNMLKFWGKKTFLLEMDEVEQFE